MKKIISAFLSVFMLMSLAATVALAAPKYRYDSTLDSGVGDGIVIESSGGKSIDLIGHVEPTIISVTMPSYIPFDISKSIMNENKAVSPRISVQNQSSVPVSVLVDYTKVDLSGLGKTTWSSSGKVADTQLAVGFTEADTQPTTLSGAKWIAQGKQSLQLLSLNAKEGGTLFVVGAIGSEVPESKTFTVTPTLVVRKAI